MRIVATMLLCGLLASSCSGSDSANDEASGSTPPPTAQVGAPPIPPPGPSPTPDLDQPEVVVLGQSPEGFSYYIEYETQRGIPNGTLLVDAGEVKPALLDPSRTFPAVRDMVFGPDGLIAFTSDHYNYGPLVFIGRTDADGQIRDLHQVGWGLFGDERPINSGSFDERGAFTSGDFQLDTTTDPMFVMTADPVPEIDEDRELLESHAAPTESFRSQWYSGDTLGAEPACGAKTLYRSSLEGWVRVIDPSIEIDPVVHIATTGSRPVGGIDTVGLAQDVIISTECPAEYEGRRLYWASDTVDLGDNGPALKGVISPELLGDGFTVAEVLDIEPVANNDCCGYIDSIDIHVLTLAGENVFFTASRVRNPAWTDGGSEPYELTVLASRPEGAANESVFPLTSLGPAVWLIQSIDGADRVVRSDLATGEVVEDLWREDRKQRVPANRHTLECAQDSNSVISFVDVTYQFTGPWRGNYREVRSMSGEIIEDFSQIVTGWNPPVATSEICGQPRLVPLRITAMQLTALLETAGFADTAGDHAIDPNWSAVAGWDGVAYVIDLYQGEFRPEPDADHELLECPPGGLRLPLDLPSDARAAVLEAAECSL